MKKLKNLRYDVLDELLGFSLRRAQIAMFQAFYDSTRGSGLTPTRFTALVIIGANAGISQTLLGNALGIARSGAMLLTDWLEDRRWVERKAKPGDGRAWGLHLTRRGAAVLARAQGRVAEWDARRAAGLTAKERRELLRLLGKLAG